MQVESLEAVWNECLNVIEAEVDSDSFKTWFKPIKPLKLDNKVLTVEVPSQYFYEWLEERFLHILKKAITQSIGQEGKLQYSIVVDQGRDKSSKYSINIPQGNDRKKNPNESGSPFHIPTVNNDVKVSNLNPNFVFENFIEGDCNKLARSAGLAVAQRPGVTSFNPLFFYSGVGLGKTHLVQAIGNYITTNFRNSFVLYVSSEKFTNQFLDSLANNKIQEFRNFYMQVDVLIIDDVQFLANKEKTQEIFFNIFNHLHQMGKQIILTSDRRPKDLMGMEDRLLSRFKWGLTADLQLPDYETRIAIIRSKMQDDGIYIPEDVVDYLAYSIDTNVRELEGVLISLIAHASLNRVEIDLELAKQTLKSIIDDIETEVNIDYIQKSVAEFYDINAKALKDKIRKKEIVVARQIAIYLAKEFTNYSLKEIGMHFGGRDHSTVIHSIQTVEDLCDVDHEFKKTVEELKKKIKIRS